LIIWAEKPFRDCPIKGPLAKMNCFVSNRRGFTLLELIAVMLILGFLAALAIPRYIELESVGNLRAVETAISELNGRESLIWSQIKITRTSYNEITGDDDVWALMKNDKNKSYPDLGSGNVWIVGPDQAGGTLSFRGSEGFDLSRKASTIAHPARWRQLP
jgi:prepilin-type N-terminal cleavage/methylation domain-containing protein